MNFNISAWAIRKPIPAIMLFIVLTLVGLMSFKTLPVQDFPDIEFPAVTVNVALAGATPSQLETEVTRKIEDAVAALGQIDSISSRITDGSSTTTIVFALEKDLSEAVDEVRDAVTRVRSQLPADVRDPQVAKVTGGQVILTMAVNSDTRSAEDLSWFIDSTVSKRLLGVKDVSAVTRQGGVSREVQVTLDADKLKALGITAQQVTQQLRAVQQEASGGTMELGGQSQSVRTVATVGSVAELAQMQVALGDGRMVRLSELAEVKDTIAPKTQNAMVGDKEVVSFQVARARGASDISVAKDVRAELTKISAEFPGIEITEVFNTVDRANKNYKDSMWALYEGAALAILVVFLFLRDWRATLVSAVALPLSVIPTFMVMELFFGFSLNMITLLALTLVVGILVDDAIVEVENIVRHLRMGKSPIQAATEAAAEIGLAVVATTLTLVAVFLPTAFMGGIPGKFFSQFGWTASIAVLASLLVARLLTPMMAAYFLKDSQHHESDGPLKHTYLAAVRVCLAHPWKTLLAAGVFFMGSLWIAKQLPTEFMTSGDNARINVSVELAPGARYEDTFLVANKARKALEGTPEVTRIYTSVGAGVQGGGGGGGQRSSGGEVRQATLVLSLTQPEDRDMTQKDVERLVRERLQEVPGAKFAIGSGGSGEKYSLRLAGDDPLALSQAADALEDGLRSISGLGAVSSTAGLLRPEIVIEPKFEQMASAGVTTQQIAQTIRIATSGDTDTALAKLNLPERQLPIRVWEGEALRHSLDSLSQLTVQGRTGSVRLEQVANLKFESGPAQITREDRQRNVTVSVELQGQKLGVVAAQVNQLPALQQLPPGVKKAQSGDLKRMQELFSSFGMAMLAGVLCIYMLLVLLFHSFGQPLTILVALPLSAGGAFGLLWLSGFSMSMPVLIGLLMLMGIVTKNSILLVEYAIVAQANRSITRNEAILDACAKRAQPIVMTTVAMGAGMMPIALGLNGDPAFRAPMAVAVIGGLITSTVLSLLVVPVVYELMDKLKHKMRRNKHA